MLHALGCAGFARGGRGGREELLRPVSGRRVEIKADSGRKQEANKIKIKINNWIGDRHAPHRQKRGKPKEREAEGGRGAAPGDLDADQLECRCSSDLGQLPALHNACLPSEERSRRRAGYLGA